MKGCGFMRLKALLVDDEINILRNLQQVLPWEAYDVEIVGFAKNGVQALEMVHEHSPHIIFCDIRMPIMDGIEFLQHLRVENEEIEVIMLTGYQEFEYARSVLQYRVLDYILKPIDYDALERLFIKVITTIRAQLTQNEQQDKEKELVKDIAYEKVLLDLIYGFYNEADIEKWDATFGLSQHRYMLLLLESLQDHVKLANIEEICVLMTEFTHTQLASEVVCYMIQVETGTWGIVLASDIVNVEEKQITAIMQFCYDELSRLGVQQCMIGMFESLIGATQLHQTWKMLGKEISFAEVPCTLVNEKNLLQTGDVQSVWLPTEDLVSAIKHLDRKLANQCLEEMVRELKLLSEESLQKVEMLVNSMIVYIIKELRRYDAISLQYEKDIWCQLKRSIKVKEIIELIYSTVDEAFMQHPYKRPQVSIHVAAEYIESHLSNDLAAEEVANYLNISLSYFSTLFKQHYGVTFIEYVTGVRIERAKSMLTMTKKSISDIAKSVGYNERRYFNKVFQKREGMLPSEYREQTNIRNEVS